MVYSHSFIPNETATRPPYIHSATQPLNQLIQRLYSLVKPTRPETELPFAQSRYQQGYTLF